MDPNVFEPKARIEFDLAQAKELSNVMALKALGSLTSQEMKDLDYKSVASMRWVLTTKNDRTAKARLVLLGFQMALRWPVPAGISCWLFAPTTA